MVWFFPRLQTREQSDFYHCREGTKTAGTCRNFHRLSLTFLWGFTYDIEIKNNGALISFQDNLLHEENSSEVIFTYLNKWAAFSPDEMTDRRWGAVPFVVVPLIFPVSLFRLNPWTNGYTKYCMVWFTKAAWARRFRIKSVCQHF